MNGDVDIIELRAHVAEVVARAAAGDRVRITEHGLPVALLVPLPGIDRLAAGRAEGWIESGSAAATPMPRPRRRYAALPGVTTESILERERGS